MAVSTIAKSEFRRNDNVIEGYGEVPARVDEETGDTYYGLPGGQKTTCREKAMAFAKKLDQEIRSHLKDLRQLNHRSIV